jgi:DNA polymerase
MRDRGQVLTSVFCEQTIVTVHPSSLLRAPDEAARAAAYELFLKDLRKIAKLIDG